MSSDGYARLREAMLAGDGSPGRRVVTVGLSGAARAWVLTRLQAELHAPLVCVCVDEDAADALAGDLAFFLGGEGTRLAPRVVRLPADEVLPWDELVPDQAVVSERLGALFHLARGDQFPALVLSARALMRRVIPPQVMATLCRVVRLGDDHGRDALALELVNLGYRNAPLVEDPGTFSMRGDILDVFPALHEHPLRLEFFGDTVESDEAASTRVSQRTIEASSPRCMLLPGRELFSRARPPNGKGRASRFVRPPSTSACPRRRCASGSSR
jgi:transcription-repair coupling factor (superfamily II helicase)